MSMVLSLKLVAELTDDERAALRALSLAVYPPAEEEDWPGSHLEWATPLWCIRVWGSNGELASYVGVVLRQADYNGQPVRIGGVGGVMTHPAARGRGYAGLGLQRAVEFFYEQLDVAFALLVCRPQLIAFYSSLGWQEFGGRLLVEQHGKVSEFTFNRVMMCDIRSAGPSVGTIDLCGPPW